MLGRIAMRRLGQPQDIADAVLFPPRRRLRGSPASCSRSTGSRSPTWCPTACRTC